MAKKILKSDLVTKIIDIDTLIKYDKNNKNHPDNQVDLLANLINRYGYIDEIVIDKNNVIIAGHGRLEAIKKMGYDQVEVKILDVDVKDSQILRLLHNKVSEMAETNLENISFELKEIGQDMIGDISIVELYPEFNMPNYDSGGYDPDGGQSDNHKKSYIIQVVCNDELDQDSLYVKLQDDGYNVKKI